MTITQRSKAAEPARAVFAAELRELGAVCNFPGCGHHAVHGSQMCEYHVMVRIASNGSWVDDHHPEGGHG